VNKRVAEAVIERAAGRCECCDRPFAGDEGRGRLTSDHMQGRARSESLETCWALRMDCHESKTANDPSAPHWLAKFALFAKRHSYWEAHDWALGEILWRTMKRRAG
jgi:hypothetical protein